MPPYTTTGSAEDARGEAEMLAAIDRSSAIVEFSVDGRVLCANQRFLDAFGYAENEIVGIHHSIFVDPVFATSESYRSFWRRLQGGEFIADKFRRIGKNGREVWIQASYNPILGSDGKPIKVVKFATDITQQETFARDVRGQLDAISKSQAVIEFDMDGVILAANENFCRMMGYAIGEIRGRRHAMFVDADYAAGAEYAAFWNALRRGDYQASRFRRLAKGGREVWIEAAYNPIFAADGRPVKIVKFATDITDQEVFARDARGQLAAISRSQAIIEFMVDGTILSANENFCALMGYALEEIRARHHSIFVEPDYAASQDYRDFWAKLGSGVHQQAKYLRLGKGGRKVWIQATYNPVFGDHGQMLKVVKYATDVTEQVARDREAGELRTMNSHLEQARRDADEATRAKSQFLATMSHEIRTPMNGILGMLEVALRENMPPTQRDHLVTARDSAASLLHILNDILDYSKLESGRLDLESVPFSLRLVVDEVTSMLDTQVRAKRLELTTQIDAAVPDWLMGDPVRTRQVLTNLVGNAVKFTDHGGVEIRAARMGAGLLRIEVRDSGVGISEAAQINLFQRFSQADASTTRRFGGTGLGLAISREIVSQMGGSIGVTSTPGQGSTFWFEIPLPAAAEPTGAGAQTGSEHALASPCRILIAEDNPVNQKVIRLLLAPYPHALSFVSNGQEAVAAVQANVFDMVFMDVSMPVMDGPEATRAIRQLPGRAGRVPIVALTANAMAGDRESYLAAGMNDYVSKPIVLDKILDAIARHAPAAETWEVSPAQAEAMVIDPGPAADIFADLDNLLQAVRGRTRVA